MPAQFVSTLRHHVVGKPKPVPAASGWGLAACRGLLVELCGGPATAVLTLACALVRQAQRLGEPAAWVGRRQRMFFPPDAAEAGVDLEALAVVFVPPAAAGAQGAPRALDHLVRSGGFGLVVADLGRERRLSLAAQGRLAGLARRHQTAIILLSEIGVADGRPLSLGPLVSRRIEALRHSKANGPHFTYHCEARVLHDKRGASWRHLEPCRAPSGLC
jgi:recombination protein RecA